jgi:hypothetical protein
MIDMTNKSHIISMNENTTNDTNYINILHYEWIIVFDEGQP